MKRSLFLSSYSVTVRVGDNVGTVKLHEVGFYEKPRLAAAGAADHKHVFVSCILRVLRAAAHHQPFGLRQQHVIFKYGVNIWLYILGIAP